VPALRKNGSELGEDIPQLCSEPVSTNQGNPGAIDPRESGSINNNWTAARRKTPKKMKIKMWKVRGAAHLKCIYVNSSANTNLAYFSLVESEQKNYLEKSHTQVLNV